MKKITIITIASLAMMLLWSCDKDYHMVYAPDELGMPEHDFYVEKAGGDIEIGYLSNKS